MKFTVIYVRGTYYVVLIINGQRFVGEKEYKTFGWAQKAGYKLAPHYVEET
jgi:hypothetical protein